MENVAKEPVVVKSKSFHSTGLGLRRELINPLKAYWPSSLDFFEIAPENWIDVGGKLKKDLCYFTERISFFCHGLSLSLGGPTPLNEKFLGQIKKFLDEYHIEIYSEHLSYCSDKGQLYDLLPIPFTQEAVHYVSKRIRRAQEILERPVAIENISYYLTPPLKEMDELTFLKSVLEEANCKLLLDVNNIYVNSVNHHYDPHEFLRGVPGERISYLHVAGHYNEAPEELNPNIANTVSERGRLQSRFAGWRGRREPLLIDTHGAEVVDPVWNLLDEAYRLFGVFPTLLERDFNIPTLENLVGELEHIASLQAQHSEVRRVQSA